MNCEEAETAQNGFSLSFLFKSNIVAYLFSSITFLSLWLGN